MSVTKHGKTVWDITLIKQKVRNVQIDFFCLSQAVKAQVGLNVPFFEHAA